MNLNFVAFASLTAALGGFYSLGLAMDRHYEDSFGRGRSPGKWRRWLQAAGAVGLVASMLLCFDLKGGAQGIVMWCGVLTVSAMLVSLTLSYAPRHARSLLAAVCGLTVMCLLPCVF